MINNYLKLFTLSFLLIASLALSPNALAAKSADENIRDGLNTTAGAADIDTTPEGEATVTLGTIAGRFINYIFGVVGMVFTIIILIGGYLWMTARGNEEKVSKAKTFVLNGFFGLMTIFVVWGITFLIANALAGSIGAK